MKVHYVLMLLVMLILGAGFIPWYMNNADAISGAHDGVILAGELGTVGDDFNLTFRDGIDTETLVMEYYDGSDYYTLTAEQAEQFYTYYLLNNDDSQKLYLDGTINEDGGFADLSGNGNHGTPYNGATTGTGVVRDGMSFDGTDDYIDCGNDSSFDITTKLTITGYAYIDADAPIYNGIVSKEGAYQAELRNSTKVAHFNTWESTVKKYCWSSSAVWDNSRWYFFAWVYDTGTLTLYVDGVPKSTSGYLANPIDTSANSVLIGNMGSYYTKGNLDEIRIYDRALSSDENEVLYNVPVLLGTLDGYDLYASYEYTAIESSIDNRLFYIAIPLFAIVIMLGLVFKLNN